MAVLFGSRVKQRWHSITLPAVVWEAEVDKGVENSIGSINSEAYAEEERVMVEIVEREGKSVPALSAATQRARPGWKSSARWGRGY